MELVYGIGGRKYEEKGVLDVIGEEEKRIKERSFFVFV